MSFAPSGYIVDLDELVGAYGSKNARLVKAVEKKHSDRIRENAEWFADEVADGAPTLDAAIGEIIDGKCTKKKHGFQYVYALELLSLHLGSGLFMADWINHGFLEALQASLPTKAVKKLLDPDKASNMKPPVPIPTPKDGVPGFGMWKAADCKTIADALKGIANEEIDEGLDEMRDWFGRAAKSKRALLMFWY
jgi:hypothetical protein